VSNVCFQVEVSASGQSLGQKSPTECGVSEHDREASIMGGHDPKEPKLNRNKKKLVVNNDVLGFCLLVCQLSRKNW
jgi:hypothetical protein